MASFKPPCACRRQSRKTTIGPGLHEKLPSVRASTVRDLVDRAQTIWAENSETQKTAANLLAHAVTLRHANNWDEANRYFREAVAADRMGVQANLEWGQVLLEKHAPDNATGV